jgi:hypothetical protein
MYKKSRPYFQVMESNASKALISLDYQFKRDFKKWFFYILLLLPVFTTYSINRYSLDFNPSFKIIIVTLDLLFICTFVFKTVHFSSKYIGSGIRYTALKYLYRFLGRGFYDITVRILFVFAFIISLLKLYQL